MLQFKPLQNQVVKTLTSTYFLQIYYIFNSALLFAPYALLRL